MWKKNLDSLILDEEEFDEENDDDTSEEGISYEIEELHIPNQNQLKVK